MTPFRKTLLIGLATAGLVNVSFPASANTFEAQPECASRHFDPSSPAFAAMAAKRQAALHDRLSQTPDGALTPAQETAWKTFTAKMTPPTLQNKPNRAELAALPAPERMQKMLDLMKSREGAMAERLAAVKEFYAVLTPAQQKVFDEQSEKRGRPGMRR